VRKVILRTNADARHAKAAARRLLSDGAVKPQPSPLRNQLTREFSREVAAAVEAAIANRTRALVEKNGKTNGSLKPGGPVNEMWPTLEQHQWSYINRVLTRTNGNKSEAAAMLGLHRRSLQRLLRRNGGRAGSNKTGRSARKPAAPQVVTGDGTIILEALTFSEIERAILAWALQRHDGSGRQAARSLGLARSTFADKVNRYRLKTPPSTKRRAAR
jgi:DNA-binding NtrC family response regulator